MHSERTIELRGLDGQSFRFAPGAACLELTVTGGQGERAAFETLRTPDDLAGWLRDALELPVTTTSEADLAVIRRLREAVWHTAGAAAADAPLPPAWVAVINECAAAPPPAPYVDLDSAMRWIEPVTFTQALSTLARDAVDVLSGPSTRRIRRCTAPDCHLLFLDTSRPGTRRWCSMQRCGNRAKARQFRRRSHEEGPS